MYKCLDCGCEFDEDDVYEWDEDYGLDSPPYQHFCGCPSCHGVYEEARECERCGNTFCESELLYGMCVNCRKEIDEYG